MLKIHKNNWQLLLLASIIILVIVMMGTVVTAQAGTKGVTKVIGKTYGECC